METAKATDPAKPLNSFPLEKVRGCPFKAYMRLDNELVVGIIDHGEISNAVLVLYQKSGTQICRLCGFSHGQGYWNTDEEVENLELELPDLGRVVISLNT